LTGHIFSDSEFSHKVDYMEKDIFSKKEGLNFNYKEDIEYGL